MKIQLLSDIHSECFNDLQLIKFIDSLQSSDVDILILAGDVGNFKTFPDTIRLLCNKYKKVLHVLGNHEYWHGSPDKVSENCNKLSKELSNYNLLNNSLVEIEGQRFLGTTLWFRDSAATKNLESRWVDFEQIEDSLPWIYEENKKSIDFLEKEMKEGDIVISHHLPSNESISLRYRNNPSNCFFSCPMDSLILERKPKFWFHGHTHDTVNVKIGDTLILNNPYGYHEYALNDRFNPVMKINI